MKHLFCVLMLVVGILVFSACQSGNETIESPEIKKSDYKFEEIKIPKNTVLIDAGHGGIDRTKIYHKTIYEVSGMTLKGNVEKYSLF